MSTLTISEFVIPNCQYSGEVTLRVWYDPSFTASDNTIVQGGPQNWFAEIVCTLDEGTAELTIPEFDLITTDDPLPVNSAHSVASGQLYVGEAAKDFLFSQFTIPVSLAPSTTFAALQIYNAATVLAYTPDSAYLNRDQVIALINEMT